MLFVCEKEGGLIDSHESQSGADASVFNGDAQGIAFHGLQGDNLFVANHSALIDGLPQTVLPDLYREGFYPLA